MNTKRLTSTEATESAEHAHVEQQSMIEKEEVAANEADDCEERYRQNEYGEKRVSFMDDVGN